MNKFILLTSVAAIVTLGIASESWAYTKYVYDAYGRKIMSYNCVDEDACDLYEAEILTYGEDGYIISQRICNSFDNNENCTRYSSSYEYTKNEKGDLLSNKACLSFNSDGNCNGYSYYAYDNTYDANGNLISQRYCGSDRAITSCNTYKTGRIYIYDENGNKLSQRGCNSWDDNMNCISYTAYRSYDYVYDENGYMVTEKTCSAVDSSGNCTAYSAVYEYLYDKNGNKTSHRRCIISDGFNEDGTCKKYNSSDYYEYPDEYFACTDRNGGKCSTCASGYYLKKGSCIKSTDGCGSGYLEKEGKCFLSSIGCGEGYKNMGGYCNRIRYTPAEAAAVLHDDNTNSVTITFKK